MAFAILGTPKPAFFDSSGSPLENGTLSVLDPSDDTNKTYYPTADDADAGTNGASGDLTLNARGEPSNALFGLDDEDYKLVLKDSDAATIWTVDDVRTPARGAIYSGTPQTLTDAGAVNLTTYTTWVVTTGTAAITLADGVEGQRKFIVMKTDGGTATLTPSNFGNGTTIVFDDVGDSANLIFTNSAWHFVGGTAALTGSALFATASEIRVGTVTNKPIAPDQLLASTFAWAGSSFTPTHTGFSSAPSGDIYYAKMANQVVVTCNFTTGTSNATTWTITNVPSTIYSNIVQIVPIIVTDAADSGAGSIGTVYISTGGTWYFGYSTDNQTGGGFTGSGSKGIVASSLQFSYMVDQAPQTP